MEQVKNSLQDSTITFTSLFFVNWYKLMLLIFSMKLVIVLFIITVSFTAEVDPE